MFVQDPGGGRALTAAPYERSGCSSQEVGSDSNSDHRYPETRGLVLPRRRDPRRSVSGFPLVRRTTSIEYRLSLDAECDHGAVVGIGHVIRQDDHVLVAMLAVNDRLGFVRDFAQIGALKKL